MSGQNPLSSSNFSEKCLSWSNTCVRHRFPACLYKNIARGTMDPGYCLFNLSYLSSLKLALVPILITRWGNLHWLQNCPPDGATCISSKLDHQVESLASVAKLSTRWRHLHECKFGHQLVLLALVTNLATRWRHLHWLQIWPPDGTTYN